MFCKFLRFKIIVLSFKPHSTYNIDIDIVCFDPLARKELFEGSSLARDSNPRHYSHLSARLTTRPTRQDFNYFIFKTMSSLFVKQDKIKLMSIKKVSFLILSIIFGSRWVIEYDTALSSNIGLRFSLTFSESCFESFNRSS